MSNENERDAVETDERRAALCSDDGRTFRDGISSPPLLLLSFRLCGQSLINFKRLHAVHLDGWPHTVSLPTVPCHAIRILFTSFF